MAAQIRGRRLSPVELADAHLAKIERLNPKLNAFVHVDADRVRREARAAEAAVTSGKTLGPLHGVPISIKSSLDVATLRSEAGTRLRAGLSLHKTLRSWRACATRERSCWASLTLPNS